MTNYYTCQPTIDHESSSTKLTISYKYEIDTPSGSNIQEAVDEVQNAMLYSIAEVSGLSSCGVEDVWRRRGQRELLLNGSNEEGTIEGIKGGIGNEEGSSIRGRQLPSLTTTSSNNQQHRKLARGSNSIIALSSLPQDTITDLQCNSAIELAQTRINQDSIFGDNTVKESTPSRASEMTVGLVSMAPDESEQESTEGQGSEGIDTSGLPSSVTRVDGHTISSSNSAAAATTPIIQQRSAIPNDFVGSGYNSGTAFNYISTQSTPKESNSSNNNTRRKLQQDSCTVIQGQMTIYTSSTPEEATYENLQQRILDSLILNVRNEDLDLDGSGLEVRMYNTDIPNAIELSNGYNMISAAEAMNDNGSGSNPNNYGTTVYLAILISLSVVAIWLLAGFIYTSSSMKKGRKRQLLDKNGKLIDTGEEGSNHTYYENEPMEMTFEKSCTFDNSEDLSVEGNGTPTQRGGGILGMLTPNRKKKTTVPDEVDMDEDVAGVGETSNVDMDVSVFDCDEQTPAHVKAAARKRANENGAPTDVNDSAFYSSNLVPDDLHQPLNDSKISDAAVGNGWGAGMIGQLFGGMQRTQTHRCTEVETSLHPFEDCEDYSVAPPMKNEVIPEDKEAPVNMVEPTLVVGNVTNEGDRILLNTQQDTDRKNRKAGLLGRFLKRGGDNREVTNDSDHAIGADIEEVHEIYGADAAHDNQVSRKPSPLPNQGRETPIYMMQNRSPPRRPIESYRSPSELRYTRSQLSDCGYSEQAQLCGANDLNGASPAHITPSPARRNRSNMSSSTNKSAVDDAASNAQSADENSVMPYQNTGVMCQGMEEWKGVQQTLECFVEDWNPFNWA